MIHKILFPTDFSPAATNALNFAVELAKKTQATLHVLHFNHVALVDASMPAETYQLFVNEIETFTKEQFQQMETTILKPSGIDFLLSSCYGFVSDEICDFAAKNKMDLIVMGTTGASGLEEVLVGSNTASVVHKTSVPVLVIPPHSAFNHLSTIVYATDYNEPEFPAMVRLIYFAELFESTIDVIHVQSEHDKFFHAGNNFFAKNKDKFDYKKFNYLELPQGDVLSTINSYVEERKPELLVMAKHNRHFFDRLFHRSLTKRMAYHATIPLLILVK